MPPRWLSVLIVVSWLAATGWLFWHDLWPSWRPGEPPKFSIDLVEEVQNRDALKTSWSVQRKTKTDEKPLNIFHALTWVDYQPKEDTFTLHAHMEARRLDPRKPYPLQKLSFAVKSMDSEYRVTRTGQLRELRFWVDLIPEPTSKAAKLNGDAGKNAQLLLEGKARGDQFVAHCSLSGTLVPKEFKIDLPPASLSDNSSVLLPLHPVNRIHGLRPGQSWRQSLVDPLDDAFGSLLGSGGMHSINAHVLSQPQVLKRDDGSETTCLVIEYEEEGQFAGRTWVEQESDHVQQQEAMLDGDLWLMKRDIPRKSIKRPF